MAYFEFHPVDAFRPLVDAYWINQRDADGGAAPDRVLPDGCIDLIFCGGPGGGRLFVSALIERPTFFRAGGPAWFAGVRFRPAMARAILDVEPADCRDRDTPAAAVDRRFAALEDRLRHCASADTALAVLTQVVEARLAARDADAAPPRVRQAIALLERGSDAAQVRDVARAIGIAERSLQRELMRWTGLAPKSLARILRMRRTLRAIRTGRAPLAEIAIVMGYADQAHMTRELKALAGYTPAALLRRGRNLQDARRVAT